jgi:hypothetical protein
MIRFVFFAFLFIVLYKLLRSLIKSYEVSHRSEEVSAGSSTAELVQDPQCGAYILPAQGVAVTIDREIHYFCSERCRNQFLEEQKTNQE